MKKIIIFSFLAGIIINFSSCDKAEKDYSDSDALYKKIIKTYTLNEDGSVDYQYQHELDLYSYYAFNRLYGETFIVYNPDYQTLKIDTSYTTMADGKIVQSPENAYNEVLPRMASGAPPYSHLREMVVTHTGLERNSTINLKYELKSAGDFMPFLMGNEVLAKTSPVRELIIKVRVPKERELNYKLLNAEEKLNIARKGDTKEYKWVFKDISPTERENNQPEFGTHLPRLIFSTENLEGAYNYFTGEISYQLPDAIESSIDDVVTNSETKLDSILSLQKMVVQHMNHFNIPLKYKGFKLKSNEQVLEDNGGTAEEKTILLASLYKKLGYEAYPVAVIPEEYYGDQTGNLKNFEKYFVKVKQNKNFLYLSAINKNKFTAKYEFPNEVALVLDKNKGKPKIEKWEKNQGEAKFSGKFEITDDYNLKGELEGKLTYGENPYLSIKANDKIVSSMISPGFPASSIVNSKIDTLTPAETLISYSISKELSKEKQEEYIFIEIPEISTGLDHWHLKNMVSDRRTPMELDYPIHIGYTYRIKKPVSLKLVTENIEVKEENEVGKVSISIQVSDDDILIDKYLNLSAHKIATENYKALYELVTKWYKENYKTLVLKEVSKQ